MGRYDTEAFKRGHEERLTRFIRTNSIRRCPDDRLVLYKAVRADLGSWYCRRFASRHAQGGIYKPGAEVRCRRFSRDPRFECSSGLHVSNLAGARFFSAWDAPVIVRVLVDPADIVCIPLTTSETVPKIRVKRLYVDAIVKGRRYVSIES